MTSPLSLMILVFFFILFFFVYLGKSLSILMVLFKEQTFPNFFPIANVELANLY